jgi:hypothetical protein
MVWVEMIINERRGKEMVSAKKWIWVLLVGVVVAGVMAIQGMGRRREGPQIAIEEDVDPVEIYFYLSEKPLLNKEVRLVTTVIPNRDIGTGSVRLTFPEGITLVEKEGLTWEGEIKKDEFIQLPTKVRLTKVGKWIIEAEVKGKDVLKKGVLTIEVTETDVSLSSEEAEYILNPLPPDKFVFVEVREENKGQVVIEPSGIMPSPLYWFSTTIKVDKINKKLILPVIPIEEAKIKARLDEAIMIGSYRISFTSSLKIRGQERTLGLSKRLFSPFLPCIIKGYPIPRIHAGRPTEPLHPIPILVAIHKDKLKQIKSIPLYSERQIIENLSTPVVHWREPIMIIEITDKGDLRINYRNKKEIIFSGDSWSAEDIIIADDGTKVKSKITVINHGIIDKNEIVIKRRLPLR